MSDRVIKASLLSSPQVDALTWFQEVVFVRMILAADDQGRLDSRARMLANSLFPTKDNVTFESIRDAVIALEKQNLICRIQDGDREYLKLITWEKHQRAESQKKEPAKPKETKAQKGARIVYSEAFETFWKAYPRHVKKSDAYKAFSAYDESLLPAMLKAIEQQKKSQQWQEAGGKYIPHPTTWLNQRRWEDEVPSAPEYKAPSPNRGLEEWN